MIKVVVVTHLKVYVRRPKRENMTIQ